MAGGFTHILGSSSNAGDWGGLCFAAILIIAWVIKAISGAIKMAARQSPPRVGPPPVPVVGRPGSPLQVGPAMQAKVVAALNQAVATKGKGGKRRAQAAPLPPPPPQVSTVSMPASQVLGTIQPAASQTRRPKSQRDQIAEAMRRRIIWTEILGQPLALRDDDRSI